MQFNARAVAESLEQQLPCRDYDPELFFAESPADVEYAKSLCQECPIRLQCLAGTRSAGALGSVGRRAIRRGRRCAAQAAARPRKTEAAA